ncbi:MAG: hypothetical protein EON90_09985 [Brevundimonas sp.]|nr:MAG: hypothetical protein EON90_09985 [Brevundimonas sp.]
MSVAVIKAVTKRIRLRYGSTEAAATAAGVSPGVWSGYENADHPQTTIPLGRLVGMSLTSDERSALAAMFSDESATASDNVLTDAMEATEAVARVMGTVRLAAADGELTETEKRRIRAEALEARAQLDDVIQGVG